MHIGNCYKSCGVILYLPVYLVVLQFPQIQSLSYSDSKGSLFKWTPPPVTTPFHRQWAIDGAEIRKDFNQLSWFR